MKELILIRHGDIDNKNKILYGHTDISLNKTGIKHIKNIKQKLLSESIETAYSSDLCRCRETVELLNLKCKVNYTKKLREMNFGEWEGLTFDQIHSQSPGLALKWNKDWINFKVPDGESLFLMAERVISEIKKITGHHENKIAIITHGGCIRAILSHFLFGDQNGHWYFQIDFGSISKFVLNGQNNYIKSLNELYN